MQFEYTARDQAGVMVQGTIEADSESLAGDLLLAKDLIVTKLVAVTSGQDFLKKIQSFFGGVSKKDLAVFLRQLSILISAAVPLVQSLRILSQQDLKPSLKTAVSDIVNEVEGGMKFSQGLERYPGIFNDFFVNMVKSGETTGRLEEVLSYLADQQERDYELQSKISGAMAYPLFIIGVMILSGFVMMVFILPKMLEMFKQFGPDVQLPFTTQLLMNASYFSTNYWWLAILLMIGSVVGVKLYSKTPEGSLMIDRVKMGIPVFGNLFRYIYIVRFTRSFKTILVGGVTIPNGLRIVRHVVGSPVYEALIVNAIHEVEEGNPISTVFLASKDLPNMVSQMVSVGEQTGRLDDVLGKITEFYEREIDAITENTLKLIEPMIMLLLGGAVAIMVSGILMPMMQLSMQAGGN